MKIKNAYYDKENESVKAFFGRGTCISIICPMLEQQLDANARQTQELNWLIKNNPMKYALLVINNDIQDYLNNVCRDYIVF